jgi:hypothetical protein
VYGLRRRRMTHSQLMRSELGESLDHLKQAATYAAGGIGAMGPRVASAREYVKPEHIRDAASASWETTVAALAPLAVALKDGAEQARKVQAKQLRKLKKERHMSRRRWPMLVGLLAAGTAAGAAGAVVMRRRRRQQWDEYGMMDDSQAMVDSAKGSMNNAMDRAAAGMDRAAETAGSAIDKGVTKGSSAADSARDKLGTATDTAQRATERGGETTDELISKAGSPSKNSRS